MAVVAMNQAVSGNVLGANWVEISALWAFLGVLLSLEMINTSGKWAGVSRHSKV